jgi:hypothetical protein
MKLRADRRNEKRKTGRMSWQPKVNDLVLDKCQPVADAVQGLTSKFQRQYEGPFLIHRRVNPSICELSDSKGKARGLFCLKHLKPYRKENLEPETSTQGQ